MTRTPLPHPLPCLPRPKIIKVCVTKTKEPFSRMRNRVRFEHKVYGLHDVGGKQTGASDVGVSRVVVNCLAEPIDWDPSLKTWGGEGCGHGCQKYLEWFSDQIDFLMEAAWPSGQGAGIVIWRSRVQIVLPTTRWICLRWSRIQLFHAL